MGAWLVAFGVFIWFGFSMISFVFLTTWSDNLFERLKRSASVNLVKTTGMEFGISLMKVAGFFWIATGLTIILIGESFLKGVRGDIVLIIIILAPVWIGAIITERRRNKNH